MWGLAQAERISSRYVQPLLVGVEWQRRGGTYFWDNRQRSPACLFQYTLAGEGMLEVNGTSYPVPPGHALLLTMPSATSYGITHARDWEFAFLKFYGRMALEIVEMINRHHGYRLALPPTHPVIGYLEKIIRLAGDGAGLSAQVMELATLFTMNLEEAFPKPHTNIPPGITRALELLETSYHQPWLNVEALAAEARLSRSHFTREFIRYTGQRPHQMLTRRRMDEALELLRSTRLPLREIAQRTGYNGVAHFCWAFKRFYGKSPGACR